jgi:poly(hydroxyalkanoate) depolymerase family esterase
MNHRAHRVHTAAAMRHLVLAAVLAASSSANAALTQVTSFGSNPGALAMYEYVPANLPANQPLVVVLHGCTQSATSMINAGWNALADQYQFAVLYPQQQSANNPVECFNWAGEYGDTANLVRGQGENQSIISMIDTEIATHHVDASRVYVVGFSAGAAFTAVLAATWPDRFAGAAIMSGVSYRCATSVSEAYSCQSPGVSKTAPQWGDLVRAASTVGHFPRIQLWQGTSDTTVAPMNQGELVKQWTNAWGTDQTAAETETLANSAGTRTAYKAGSQIVVEAYSISGMSHAVVVGTDGGVTCPGTAGSYFEDHKVCSTLRAAKFFGVVPGGSGSGSGSGSGGAPYVAIVAPSDGQDVSGSVGVVVAAGGDVAIANVALAIDGATIGTDDTAPYQFTWTAPTAPGTHTLVATATDANGQTATAMATVTVAGGGSGAGSGNGNGETGGGGNGLPACSLNAGGASSGWFPLALVLFVVTRRRRR